MKTYHYDVFDVIESEYIAVDISSAEVSKITGIYAGSIWRYKHAGTVYKKRYLFEDHYADEELTENWASEWEEARRLVNPDARRKMAPSY